MLSPFHPEIGMNGMVSGLYPTFFKNSETSFLIYSYLDSAKLTVFSVHLVATNDHLLNTEGEGKESVFSGLSFFRNTSLELTLR